VEGLRYGLSVRESLRFALREVAADGRVASYRLRSSGLRCSLRHDGHDAWVLHEVFGKRAYAPPPRLAGLLGAGESPRVVDVGAHLGLFGLYVLGSCPTARITSFEPDPDNAALLERTVAANGLRPRWEIVRAAASVASGRVGFAAGLGERSHLAAAGDRDATTVDAIDLFGCLDDVDLLKIDIEGGEWAILADARFLAIPARAIVVEYHSHLCPEADPERAATTRLAEAGYTVISAADASLTRDVGVLWAFRAAPTGRTRGRSGDPPASVASWTA